MRPRSLASRVTAPALAGLVLLAAGGPAGASPADSAQAAPGAAARFEPVSTARPLGVTGQPAPRAAVVPLENLTARADVGELLTRMLFAETAHLGLFDLVEPGVVNQTLEDLRIRPTGTLSRTELQGLRDSLGLDYVMIGTVLESGTVHAWDAEVPVVALALRLLDATTGRVVWADFGARSGDDRETVFGFGRETYGDKLAGAVIREMLETLHVRATQAAATARTGARR